MTGTRLLLLQLFTLLAARHGRHGVWLGVGAVIDFDVTYTQRESLAQHPVGSLHLNDDEASFVDVVSSCSSLDAFHCPLAGFVLVGSRGGDVLLLSREGAPALEVAGPPGSGAVRVVRVVQARAYRLKHDVLLVGSFDGVPGLHGLLVDHRTMEVDARGWMAMSDAVRDVADVRVVSSTLSSSKDGMRLVLPAVAVLSATGDAYVGLDVPVPAPAPVGGAESWPLHLVKRGATHVFASYKFGLYLVADDNAYRIDRKTLDALPLPLPCWGDGDDRVLSVAFDDVFHEVHVSSVVRSIDGYTLRRHRLAPGGCVEVHSIPLLDRLAVDGPDRLSSSGGYSLVSGSGVAVLYNHSMALVHDRAASWDHRRFIVSVASEEDFVGVAPAPASASSPGRPALPPSLSLSLPLSLLRLAERFQRWATGFDPSSPLSPSSQTRAGGFEAALSVWGPLAFLYRNTMVVVSSSRRTVHLYRPVQLRAVIGKASTARSKELATLLLGILKSFGLIGAGVIGLMLSKRNGTAGQATMDPSLDGQLKMKTVYAEYKRERDSTRAARRRKVPVGASGGDGRLRQNDIVDYAPDYPAPDYPAPDYPEWM